MQRSRAVCTATHDVWFTSGSRLSGGSNAAHRDVPVSYTHLTLPTTSLV